MKTSGVIFAILFGALLAAASNQAQAKNEKTISLTPIGRYSAGPSAAQPVLPRAEIAAYDPATIGSSRSTRISPVSMSWTSVPHICRHRLPRSLSEATYCRTALPSTMASSPSPCKPIRKPTLAL